MLPKKVSGRGKGFREFDVADETPGIEGGGGADFCMLFFNCGGEKERRRKRRSQPYPFLARYRGAGWRGLFLGEQRATRYGC